MTEGALVDEAELLPTPAEIAPTAHQAARSAGTGMSTAPAVARRRQAPRPAGC